MKLTGTFRAKTTVTKKPVFAVEGGITSGSLPLQTLSYSYLRPFHVQLYLKHSCLGGFEPE